MLNIEKPRSKVKVIILIIFHLYILFFFLFLDLLEHINDHFFISRFTQMHFLIIFYVSWFNRRHFLILLVSFLSSRLSQFSSFVIIPKILIKKSRKFSIHSSFFNSFIDFFVFYDQKLRIVSGRKYIYCFSGNFDSFNVLKGQLLKIWAVKNLVFLTIIE